MNTAFMHLIRTRCLSFLAAGALLTTAFRSAADDGVAELVERVRDSVLRVEWSAVALTEKDGKIMETALNTTASGFIIREGAEVYIVTNHHAVDTSGYRLKGPVEYQVRNNVSSSVYVPVKCELVGSDPVADLAVLKPAMNLGKPVQFASPQSLRTGMEVVVIGFAQSIEGEATVTRGILSAQERDQNLGLISGLIQTDAATNPGNSGCPWFNRNGEVIGVHTYGLGPELMVGEGGALQVKKVEAINMARSVKTAAPLVRRIIRDGSVRRTDPGFRFDTFSPVLGARFGLPGGAKVTELVAGQPRRITAQVFEKHFVTNPAGPSPFSQMAAHTPLPGAFGFNTGDLITGIQTDDTAWPIRNAGDLLNALGVIEPGTKIHIDFLRPKSAESMNVIMQTADQVQSAGKSVMLSSDSISAAMQVVSAYSSPPGMTKCYLDTEL